MEKQTLRDCVLACAVKVHKTLGVGFLEKVYENALMLELNKAGLKAEQQRSVPVYYEGHIVGDFYADIIVDDTLILELKAVKAFANEHSACCMNYLRCTNLPVCLLLNFGQTIIQIKRLVGDTYINYPNPI